jgi:uncharacterized protein
LERWSKITNVTTPSHTPHNPFSFGKVASMFPSLLTSASILAFVTSKSRFLGNMASFSTTTTNLQASAGDATSEPTKQYILRYDYIPEVLERRGPYREEHLALAKRSCISGGPTASTKNPSIPIGALFIFPDAHSATSFVDSDPYVSAGIVTGFSIEEWSVAIQN